MFRICAAARLRRTSALCLLGTLSVVLPPAQLPALSTESPDSPLHGARPPHNRADSTQIVQRAREATTAFLRIWRHAWLRSDYAQWTALERSMPRSDNPRYSSLGSYQHWCNFAWKPPVARNTPERQSHLIPTATAPLPSLICPTWSINPRYDADASVVIDSALTTEERRAVVAARDSLLTELRTAVSQLPGDGWLRAQYIRFLVDQGFHDTRYHAEALSAAQSCRRDLWWCGMLAGYVHARQGRLAEAGAAFTQARDAAPEAIRCQVDNVVGLVDRRVVPRGVTLPGSCAEHAAFARTLWWLADPFWSDALNERQIEHDVRTTRLLLAASLPVSEHFDWSPSDPTDAVGQLVTRYGWPSTMHWSTIVQSRKTGPPTSTASVRFETGKDPIEQAPSEGEAWNWWPFEHATLPRPLHAVTEWQVQQWRRADHARLAIATQMPSLRPALAPRSSDSLTASLIAAASPLAVRPIDARRTSALQPVVLAGALAFDSSVVSLELRMDAQRGVDARLRLGLTAEPPLATLAVGQVAMAQPALLAPHSSSSVSMDSIEAHLLPSTTVLAQSVVGLYFESYGFAADDSVQYTLQVERLNRRGVFERVSVALGGGRGDASGNRIQWTDTRPGELLSASSQAPSVHGRYLTLSTAGLRPGDYALTVSMRSTRGAHASRSRLFQIVANR
ncbi:tetratricopeptide repeat protein [Gemmatimonas sp. UBA7669]|uniref:tetratricopeptide repeat protein n=1 Tax=Gemmatimonas sp. UBA7669 TaxID=1946568 RepID=UPI0025C6520A|nr:hypothetical protein [Gemmatimonas sp. UBA7669]